MEFAELPATQFTAAANSTDEGDVAAIKQHNPSSLPNWKNGISSCWHVTKFSRKWPDSTNTWPQSILTHRPHRLVGCAGLGRRESRSETRVGTSVSVSERRVFAEIRGVLRLRHHEVRHIRTGNSPHPHAFHKVVQHAIVASHRAIG